MGITTTTRGSEYVADNKRSEADQLQGRPIQEEESQSGWFQCRRDSMQCFAKAYDLDLIVQGDLLRKVVTNEEDSATSEELLLAGYVVDVPLSFEGSWIRVGIWNADDGVVEMVPVHVPFGSVLVRCNTLPHSGNYGSPGNTRFHAQLRIVINIIGRKLPPRKSYKSLGWCM